MADETITTQDIGALEQVLGQTPGKTKIRLIYPHSIGDRIELHSVVFNREGEHHYGYADPDLANAIVAEGNGEIVI
jgi:hypothetical protein